MQQCSHSQIIDVSSIGFWCTGEWVEECKKSERFHTSRGSAGGVFPRSAARIVGVRVGTIRVMSTKHTPGLPPGDELISLAQAAKLLPHPMPGRKVSIRSLLRRIWAGKLRAWKLGRNWFVSRFDVLSQLEPFKPVQRCKPAHDLGEAERHKRTLEVLKRYGVG